MDEARVLLFVIAPFDLTALGGLRIAGVTQVGGVALVAQQRIADLLAGAGELGVGPEEGQRMVDRHDRQVFARHFRDQAAPEAGANDAVRSEERRGGKEGVSTWSTRGVAK